MKRIQLAIAVFAIIFTLTITLNSVKAETATIWTDKQDYSPEETVIIYGKDFILDTTITIDLTRPDGHIDTWTAYSDSSGQFTTTYLLDGITGTYTATATDGTNTATTTFTDSPKVGSVTVGSQSPNPVTAGNNATYTVTVNRGSGGGSSGAFTADLTVTTALPSGTSASFFPNPVSFTSKDDVMTSQLNITTSTSTPGGSYSFTVKAATSATDYATGTGTLAVLAVDTTPPTTTSSLSGTLGSDGWYVSNVGVTLTATDTGGSGVKEIHYILDSGTEQIVSGSTATFTISTDGTHSLEYWAIDNALNVETPHNTRSIKVDKTAPVVTITAPTSGFYKTSTLPALDYTVTETNSHTEVVSGWATTEGVHTVTVTSTDAAGNVGSDSVTYTVDNTAPVVDITAPTDGAYYKTANVPLAAYTATDTSPITVVQAGYSTAEGVHTYTVTATDGAGNSGSASVTYTVDNTAPVVVINAPAEGGYYKTSTLPALDYAVNEINPHSEVVSGWAMTEGVHTVTVTSTDAAGNVGSASVTYTVDNTAPVVTINAPVDGEYYKSSAVPAAGFSVVEINPYTTVESGYSTSEGVHTYTVTATDSAGNVGSASVTYTVDNTPPVVTITAPANGLYYKTADVPSAAFTIVEANPYTTSESGYATTEGPHTYIVTATDAAGNVGSDSVTYTVDNTAPVVTITAPANGAYYKSSAVPVAAYSVVELNPYTVVESGYSTAEGAHTYTVTATDAAGNVGSDSVTYTVDNTPPVVTITAPANGAYYKTADVPTAAYSVVELNPYTLTETGYSTNEGVQTYTVTAIDAAGNVGAASVTYTVDNTAPVVTITAPADGAYYTTVNVPAKAFSVDEINPYTTAEAGYSTSEGHNTYTVTATDGAGNVGSDSVTYTVDNTAPVVTITAPANGAYYKTANVPSASYAVVELNPYTVVESGYSTAEGVQTYTVTATDSAGNVGSASVTYTVDNTAPIVTITAPANGAYYTTADVPAGAFTVAEINPYTTVESGWANSPDGSKTYTVTATDDAGNTGSASVTYTVDNVAPVVTITAPADGAYYETIDVPVKAFTVVETNPYTTVEAGYSTAEGVHTYTVTATDGAGNVGSDYVTYTVDNTAPVVTITAPVDGGHYNVGTVPSLAYTVVESNPYTTSDSGYSTTKGTHTLTVTATDAAGNVGSDFATYTVGETTLTYTGATSGEYSDSVTVSATLTEVATSTPLSGKTISFAIGSQTATATTDASGVATASITLTQPSGVYTVTASFAGDTNYLSSSDSESFTIDKETVTITYTGDTLVFTAGPTISTAPVRLSASLVQEDDGYKGDLTLAKVRFELFKSSNTGTTPDIVVGNVPVNAAGEALTTATLGVDVWTVFVKIEPTNLYWKPSEVIQSILTVDYGSNERRVTGGGWIPDSQSANGKGNFGFTVNYNKNGAPKGSFVYVFRGKDGYNYVVKSNSWQGGGLSFSGTNKAYFSGKCNVQKIDRTTGQVVESWGGYRFAVDITDGDLNSPRTTDTIAISIFDSTGAIWRQIGTPTSPIALGGGNIVIHSKQQ